MSYTLSHQQLETLFPFSFSVASDGSLRSIGPSLKKLNPEMDLGQHFDKYFTFLRPRVAQFGQDIQSMKSEMIILKENKTESPLMGQILYSEETDSTVFVVSLFVQKIDQVANLGLTFNDFAIQDQVFDFLMLLQSQRRAALEADHLNRKLAEAHRIAVEASNTKTEFLMNMSHELRTPMNGVLGMASVLANTELDVLQKECVDCITKSGEGMIRLIEDILDLSNIESGKLVLVDAKISPANLVKEVVRSFELDASKKRILLNLKIAPNLPEYIFVDPGKLKQVLNNLIDNSIKFTEKGTVAISLSSYKNTEGSTQLGFTIKDTGIGMTENTLNKIFVPFVQGDSSMSKQYGGTGLGLSICKKIVSAMGGKITVNSQPGIGSEFEFNVSYRD